MSWLSIIPCAYSRRLDARDLSYMLIGNAIKAAEAGNRLIRAKPVTPWAGEPRVFLMCKPLSDAINDGRMEENESVMRRWAQLEADISHFIEGGFINSSLMKQLDPPKHEVWELISRNPSPGLRVFGRFAQPDVFVGTHVKHRKCLGDKRSMKWEFAKLDCEQYWLDAGLTTPFSGTKYEDYITENASQTVRMPR